jgi:NTP pyrophosphatase (non-canonical NTP hydrolase)
MMAGEIMATLMEAAMENQLDMLTYQVKAAQTAVYPDIGNNFVYPTLGLVGEAGELANKAKKVMRDHGGKMPEEFRAAMVDELGDVLWYVAVLANELGVSLADVGEMNLEKLAKRQRAGTLRGSGDRR